MPFFSIITVVYNAASLVEATIKSVLDQSFTDFEYIIIDGNSADSTPEIIQKYTNQIHVYLSEPDEGIYDAMNKGLNLATGKYVLFINAGDELASLDTLKHLHEKSDDADILYGETNIMNEQHTVIGTRTALTTRKLPNQLTKRDFLQGQVVSHQSFVPKRALTTSYNLHYTCSADIDWMLQIISRASKIINVKEPVSNYLQGGISDNKLFKCWRERFNILLNHFTFMEVLVAHIHFAFRYVRHGKYKKL